MAGTRCSGVLWPGGGPAPLSCGNPLGSRSVQLCSTRQRYLLQKTVRGFAGSAPFCFLNESRTNISVGYLNSTAQNWVIVVKSAPKQRAKPLSHQERWFQFTKACFGSLLVELTAGKTTQTTTNEPGAHWQFVDWFNIWRSVSMSDQKTQIKVFKITFISSYWVMKSCSSTSVH